MNSKFDRRAFVVGATKLGGAAAVFPLLLAEIAEAKTELTKADVRAAEAVAGLSFDEKQEEMMLENLQDHLKAFDEIHKLNLPNSVPPALDFNPVLPGMKFESAKRPMKMSRAAEMAVPKNLEDVAFWPVR